MKTTIGIQGGLASYHEAVATRLYPNGTIRYFDTFADLFAALRSGEIGCAIAAVSNSRVGPIKESNIELDALKGKYVVRREVPVPIRHSLLGLPGANIHGIKRVHSQRPAFDQCQNYLDQNLPYAELVAEDDTALSAKLVAEQGDITKAAIASKAAGELYGLVPLQEGIQDDPDNITTFIEIAL